MEICEDLNLPDNVRFNYETLGKLLCTDLRSFQEIR